ncbi:hypothetical protein GTP44_11720 [Duganella sp. FT50W]|uniref:Uncharacterized protein n=1 Tax=Duganella lactea TaxID=2692173 RepID=A0A6L8MKC0_9BURK|nr:hypothetical protein [Duganella lactea]MYM33595.1 hypothetical protein [Duganella lactea]MYM82621.1 hypothetical protein [Duganella lactea]
MMRFAAAHIKQAERLHRIDSGLHHNVFGGLVSLQPGIDSAGAGTLKMRDVI